MESAGPSVGRHRYAANAIKRLYPEADGDIELLLLNENWELVDAAGGAVYCRLSPQLAGLVAHIEEAYQATVRWFVLNERNSVASSFYYHGHPYVRFSSAEEITPAALLHELLHLKCKINGYPTFIMRQGHEAYGEAIGQIVEIFEHQIVHEEMKDFGYVFGGAFKDTLSTSQLEGFLSRQSTPAGSFERPDLMRIVRWTWVLSVSPPQPLRDKMEALMIREAPDSFQISKQIVHRMHSCELSNPQAYLECLLWTLKLLAIPRESYAFTFLYNNAAR